MHKRVTQRIILISLVLLSINLSVVLILVHVFNTLLELNFGWVIIIASTLLTVIQISLYVMLVAEREKSLTIMTAKLEDIAAEKNPNHLLLDAGDPYYELAAAINKVQTLENNKVYWLRRREGELAALVQYLPVGVVVVNHHRKIKITNPAADELLGAKLIVGTPLYANISNHAVSQMLEQVMKAHRNQQENIEFETPVGIKYIDVRMVFHETSTTHFQIIIMLYDLTEVVQLEQMQTDFVFNASHELKTPITAISGFVETLQAGAKDDPTTLTQFLNIISNESKRLIDLVEDVLSISRFSTGTVLEDESDEQIAVKSWLDEELALMQSIADTRGIKLINQTNEEFLIMANKNYLTQIVKNLIINGIKYNRANGTVTIVAYQMLTGWQLEVSDNGIGIPTNQQGRIFERFYRGNLSRTQQIASGTGLGLAIVKELVAKLKGTISVKSQVGVGTTMIITFKLE